MRDTFEGDDDLLRRYLLGELSEEETERLEPRLLEDDRLLEQMEAVEVDLLAEYAQGELTREQEREVRRRLIATEDGKARLAMVRSLHRIGQEKPRWRSSWYVPTAALAAALLVAVVGTSVLPDLQGPPGNNIGKAVVSTPTPDPGPPKGATPGQQTVEPVTETQEVVEPAPPVKAKPEPVVVEVPFGSAQRGNEEQEILEILQRVVPKNAEEVVLRVPLREEAFTSYKAVLTLPDNSQKVFEGLELDSLPSGPGIQFPLPAASVSEGLYTIEVVGFTASGDDELVGEQKLEIRWP
jgi:hypothetical protein